MESTDEVQGAVVDYDGSSERHPEHQPRDHAVTCRKCLRRQTWNHDAICAMCHGED